MQIEIIGVPMNLGCDRPGPEQAPERLRVGGIIRLLEEYGHVVRDVGDVEIPVVPAGAKYRESPRMKYFKEVVEVNLDVADRVHHCLEKGHLGFVIGGDHSVALGSVSGASTAMRDEMGVIWIDAHSDINTDITSPSGNMHGMPLAALIGEGDSRLIDLYRMGQKVKPEHVFIVAARSFDVGEKELIARGALHVYSMERIEHDGIQAVITDLVEQVEASGLRHIHLSIDIDGIDPKFAPGTGTPVPHGLSVEEFNRLLAAILALQKVCCIDLVEFNPRLDVADQTQRLCLAIVDRIAAGLTY